MLLFTSFINVVSYLESYNEAEKSMNDDFDSDIEEQQETSAKRRKRAPKVYGAIPFKSELELDSDVGPVVAPRAVLSRALTKKTPSQESAVSHASQTPQTEQPQISASSGDVDWQSSNEVALQSPAALVPQPVHPSVEGTEYQDSQSSRPPENALPK